MAKNSPLPPLPDAFLAGCRTLLDAKGVVDDPDEIASYTVDFWRQWRGQSPLVLRPASTAEVAGIVALAATSGVALVPQSGNTGLVAGGIPDPSGSQVVLSLARLNAIRHVDPAGDHLIVEAGCVLETIQEAARGIERYFPLSLGAQGSCRIGGNIATNAGGLNVLRYGMTRNLVLGLEVVLPDGRIWNGLRALRKDNTGFDLKQIFIGSEGTLGIVTAAALRLVPLPRETQTLWLGIDSPESAVELLTIFARELGDLVSSFELLSGFGVETAVRFLEGVRAPIEGSHPWHVLIEVAWNFTEGLGQRVETALTAAMESELVRDGTIAQSEAQRANMWRIREGQSEATRELGFIVRSDVTVQINDIPVLCKRVRAWTEAEMEGVILVPFGHVGDGNLHFNFIMPEARVAELKPILLGRLYDEVTALNGSISAEHGIGRLKRDDLERLKDPVELQLMKTLKATLDPKGIMNPGAILRAE
ncbi:4-phosphoerythronate dehydrogenase (FAD-dependent) [Arboricoccus pini]|uniref:4-phosphoerythronate dehydrogenase (FAD-dependent) n=1 Tax=Arboricoccus pini TaxID=1963835 RepID=A0A212QXY5_9PROT|nr:FAD-binding oxidoreductase [Arboricoccus pini]SNB64413.1 4-phosphoerythronate dehydrogenase (FAD-dependent) [Arboricoccus pini]